MDNDAEKSEDDILDKKSDSTRLAPKGIRRNSGEVLTAELGRLMTRGAGSLETKQKKSDDARQALTGIRRISRVALATAAELAYDPKSWAIGVWTTKSGNGPFCSEELARRRLDNKKRRRPFNQGAVDCPILIITFQ